MARRYKAPPARGRRRQDHREHERGGHALVFPGNGRNPAPGPADFELTPQQRRAYRWAAVKAALAVALIFGAVFALFIAFCDFVWFRASLKRGHSCDNADRSV